MIKQLYQKIGLVVVLLLMLVAVFGTVIATQAEEEDPNYYYLKVNYSMGCEKVELTVHGQSVLEMESGVKYPIPKNNAEITLRVVLKNGYEIKEMVGLAGSYVLENNSRTWTLAASDEVNLTCQPKEYSIKYLVSVAEGYHTQPTTGSFPTSYIYGEGTNISTPLLDGYKFKYWILLASQDADDSTGQILSPKEGEDFVTLSATTLPNTDTETIYLKPKWEPNKYTVTRYDCIYDPAKPDHIGSTLSLNGVNLSEDLPMKSPISGDMGGEMNYPGFYYVSDPKYYTESTVTVRNESNWEQVNIVYRLYLPIEYTLKYESGYDGAITFQEDATVPETHVYNAATTLPIPIRTGYDFIGWTVKVTKEGVVTTFANDDGQIGIMEEAYAGDKDTEILLTAKWKAKTYQVTVDANTGGENDVTTDKYVFDTGLTVADPVRAGYTFLGWFINDGTELLSGKLEPCVYASDITMVAQWQANEYTVKLDGNGTTVPTPDELKVTFDTALNTDTLKANLPVREGHLFLGFTLTKDGEDYLIDDKGNFIPNAWTVAADTTLYAKWDVIPYLVSVDVDRANVWLNGTLYTGEPMSFNYGTAVEVRIEAEDGFKLTAWNGASVSHVKVFTTVYTIPAEDSELSATVLPMITTPAFSVDYLKEIFAPESGIQDGNYQIQCGTETLKIKVQGSTLYVNDVKVSEIAIPESFFGKAVEIMMFGDGSETADSDPILINLAARPALPVLNNQVQSIYEDYRTIAVKLNPNETYEYEFAISVKNDGTGLTWLSASDLATTTDGALAFENLNPGTIYYVYIRVKAAEGDHPHGEVNTFEQKTYFVDFLNQKINELQNLIEDGDGEMVKALIAQAIEDAKALEKPSATFYNDLEGIYNRAVSGVEFARAQDNRIAELRALRDTLLATGQFNDAGMKAIQDACELAVGQIKSAKTPDEISTEFEAGMLTMKAVKVTYLIYNELMLTSFSGLAQGTKLYGMRLTSIDSITNAVDSAIKTGKISVANGHEMTLAEAIDALRTLDVMASYNLKLNNGNATVTVFDGEYEVRLLLPEDLRGVIGLQVAYYNEKTGVIELLPTTRDGNDLVFRVSEIADFVILGDPMVNLGALIVSLSVILLCQVIAVVILLVRRSKFKKETRRYAVALPTLMLTIQFLPNHALTIVAILGGLIILMLIVLLYLLLTSEMFYRRHAKTQTRQRAEKREDSVPVMADLESEQTNGASDADGVAENTLSDEELAMAAVFAASTDENTDAEEEVLLQDDEEEELIEEDYPEEELSEEELSEEELSEEELSEIPEDGTFDEDVAEEEHEAYPYGEDDDFIEPPADPRYSLPDEDFAESDAEPDEESDEEAVSEDAEADQTWSEASEWGYDDGETLTDAEGDDETGVDDGDYEASDEETDGLTESEEELENGGLDSEETVDESEEDIPEDSEEETEEDDGEPEIYIIPDARGDAAPAPDYGVDDEELAKNFDDYEG